MREETTSAGDIALHLTAEGFHRRKTALITEAATQRDRDGMSQESSGKPKEVDFADEWAGAEGRTHSEVHHPTT